MKRLGILTAILLTGCTYGDKVRLGDTQYPPVPLEHVALLLQAPSQEKPYHQIGMVTANGAQFASGQQVYNKLRQSAADLGADAVIVQSAGSYTYSNNTYTANTTGQAATVGGVNAFGNYQSATAYQGQTTIQGPQTFTGKVVRGFAIKYD